MREKGHTLRSSRKNDPGSSSHWGGENKEAGVTDPEAWRKCPRKRGSGL